MKSAKQAKQESVEKMKLTRGDMAILKGVEREIDISISQGEFRANFEANIRHGSVIQFNLHAIKTALKENGYRVIKALDRVNPEDFSSKIEIEIDWEDA